MKKQIERYCTMIEKGLPKDCLDHGDCGCRILVPLFSETLKVKKGKLRVSEDLHETFKFKEGKKYRITVEEIEGTNKNAKKTKC